MSTLLIFNFDGTSNKPSDAKQSIDEQGNTEDDNITNIVKFHLLCGGNLKSELGQASGWKNSDQRCFYYPGVGTYGNRLQRTINALISPEKSDVASILKQARKDFELHYQVGDEILLTGFSRGGALARRFSTIVSKNRPELIITQAIFDTVASIGLPNLSKKDRPDSEVIFEHGHTLAPTVKHALHMVSLDDKRKAFQPTLMNFDKRIVEVWFAGAHSDIGGGYYQDGLSDITLQFMMNWLDKTPLKLTLKTPKDIDFSAILPKNINYTVAMDDISITPNALSHNHQQDRFPIIDWLTLTDRRCCVIEGDKITKALPLVHFSVVQKINGDNDYRPNSLKSISHQVIYSNGELVEAKGVEDHIMPAKRMLKNIDID